MHNKELSLQSSIQQPVQSSVQQPVQSTVWSNDTYAYGIGVLTILTIGVCVFLTYNTFPKNKKQANEKKDKQPKRRPMLKKIVIMKEGL